MSINSREKGIRGEQAVVRLIAPIVETAYRYAGKVPPTLQRNTQQSAGGGFDLIFARPDGIIDNTMDWLAIEIKNCATLELPKWWAQAVQQARGREPVLIYKASRGVWRVIMMGTLFIDSVNRLNAPVEVSIEVFLAYLKLRVTITLRTPECLCPEVCDCADDGRISVNCLQHAEFPKPLPNCKALKHKNERAN